MTTVRDEMMGSNNSVILPNGKCVYPVHVSEILQALHNLCYAYRRITGLDGAWDHELVQAQKLLDKYKGGV